MKNIPIVFENNDFLLLHKPAGMACHGPDSNVTVVDYLQQKNLPIFLAHRLDKETSGLLLVAKNAQVANIFMGLFANREIEKYYLALSNKKGKKKQGAIKGAMSKGRGGSWRLGKAGADKAGTGKTNRVCTQFTSFSLQAGVRLFLLKPLTGRTHQIRVALKANASPVLGDDRYGGVPADRMYLHAFALRFTYDNKQYEFVLPPNTGEFFTHHSLATLPASSNEKQEQEGGSICKALEKTYEQKPWELNWPDARF